MGFTSAHVAEASVVFAHSSVQACAIVGTGAISILRSVDHHAQLSDGVHVCPGGRLAGEVKIGARSDRHRCLRNPTGLHRLRCHSWRRRCVISDLPDGVTAAGVPARVLSST